MGPVSELGVSALNYTQGASVLGLKFLAQLPRLRD